MSVKIVKFVEDGWTHEMVFNGQMSDYDISCWLIERYGFSIVIQSIERKEVCNG